jgi:hypothetical protein
VKSEVYICRGVVSARGIRKLFYFVGERKQSDHGVFARHLYLFFFCISCQESLRFLIRQSFQLANHALFSRGFLSLILCMSFFISRFLVRAARFSYEITPCDRGTLNVCARRARIKLSPRFIASFADSAVKMVHHR